MGLERKTSRSPSVLVVGAGAWGTAVANVFSKGGCVSYLWDKNPELVSVMRRRRFHPTFRPDIYLSRTVYPVGSLQGLEVDAVVFVAPFQSLREAALHVSEEGVYSNFIVCASKGIEQESLHLAHEIFAESFGDRPFAQISGPSFASEVMAGSPTAITVGTESEELSFFLRKYLHTKFFRLYTTTDVTGVEIGGALKNIIAIAAGIADGLELGSSARSALVVRGLGEMANYGENRGAKKSTFMGLSGLGDLILTCSDDKSRNRQFGLSLASAGKFDERLSGTGRLVEGYHTARALDKLDEINFENFPVISEVISVLKNIRTPKEALDHLLSRGPKPEIF
ncbi:MAG: NAD(P)H-dependent glycerol-3-phosphate dehydrogenase [Pseudomonadota bacterium]|nr:NAD(P)H-dependent glycerol-3-phosphate dehydrogenase [Pseudomonadota bacterium]